MICTQEELSYHDQTLCHVEQDLTNTFDSFDVITASSNTEKLKFDHTLGTGNENKLKLDSNIIRLNYFASNQVIAKLKIIKLILTKFNDYVVLVAECIARPTF